MIPQELNDEEVDILEDNDNGSKVILWNDDHNTFDWVIECLVDVCKHSPQQAEQCSLLVHNRGKCVVKEGDLNTMKKIKNVLQDRKLTVSVQ